VLDVKTSAIKAVASTPVYDRNNLISYLDNEDAPFINRAFSAYPVGSVFKTVTAISAIENRIKLNTINCVGHTTKSGNTFYCNKRDGHGYVDFKTALSHSCNSYFIELGTKAGGEALLKTAKAIGFGNSIDIGNGFMTAGGALPDLKELNSEAAIGNFSFGQGSLTATPLQIALLYCVIANDGIYNKPFIYNGFTNKNGEYVPTTQCKGSRLFTKQTCETISEAMLETTISGTGKMAYTPLFQTAAKTATAQSGIYDKEGNEIKYSWFAGFFPYENPEYVICIMKENGSSGGMDGAPVFKEISENIYKYKNNRDIS
jgi:penicillin-binding protein 2